MKSLSFEQMAQIEGGSRVSVSPLCRNAYGLLILAYALGSYILIALAAVAVRRFCGRGHGGDSTFN